METLIDAIRAATAENSSSEARAAGAQACRSILTALEANAGETLAVAQPPAAAPVAAAASVATVVSALRGMSADQLLDLAITRLRSIVTDAQDVTASRLNIPLVPVPKIGGGS